MIDSTGLCAVVDECAAWSAELVVQGDGGCEGEEALQDALSEAWEGSGAVSFEGEDVLAGPEDALDPLADRREVWASAGLVFAAGPEDRRVHVADRFSECFPGVALVADQGYRASRLVRAKSSSATSRSSRLGEATVTARGVPSGAKSACSRKPQKNRLWLAQ